MGWIIATIILTIITTSLGFALFNLLKKNESLEEFITKQSDAINACDQRLKQLDDKNIFYSDDQIGWFFQELKKLQEELNEFTLKKNMKDKTKIKQEANSTPKPKKKRGRKKTKHLNFTEDTEK